MASAILADIPWETCARRVAASSTKERSSDSSKHAGDGDVLPRRPINAVVMKVA